MKTIIAGSRNVHEYAFVCNAVEQCGWDISCVISGMARGADRLGELWAASKGIRIVGFPAEWGKYGKRAGYLRNEEMAEYAEALIALWDGKSKGTKHMIEIAKKKGLKVFVYEVP